ncbi:MAG: transporter substrate-binding domain-containing protein [Desulfobulbus sp.]|nr:transporter substrate-binding domain-containing protein [Desulfobulbus sp.]
MRWRCIVVLWACIAMAMQASAGELRVALGTRIPSVDGGVSGSLSAFNEDLAREICRRLMARCEIDYVRFDNILPGVAAGKFDLGFGNYLHTSERERLVAFSRPLWHSSSRLVGRAGLSDSSDLTTLRGARVAAVTGSQQQAYLLKLADPRSLTVLSVDTMADAFTLLRDGQADFALLPVLSAYPLLVGEAAERYRFYGAPLMVDQLGGGVRIALPKKRSDLRRAVDRAIADMHRDGSYSRLVFRHFPFGLD